MNNGMLPDSWTSAALQDFCTIVLGQSPPSSAYNSDDDGLPFFQGKAEFGSLYPTARVACNKPLKIAEMEDVLLSIRAPVGPTNLAPDRCCIGRGLAALRPECEMQSRYLLYAIRCIEHELSQRGTGTTFKAITGAVLRKVRFPIAPLNEQRRIVAEIEKQFSRLDAGVAALLRVEANLKRYKAAVLKAACTGALTADWRAAHPAVEPASKLLDRILRKRRRRWEEAELDKLTAKGKRPKDDKWKARYKEPPQPKCDGLGPLPDGWLWASLGQLSLIDSGEAFKKRDYSEDGLRLFQIANVGFGRTLWDQRNFLPDRFADSHGDLILRAGDITLALNRPILGSNLKVAQIDESDLPAILYQRVARIRCIRSDLAPFVFSYMQSDEFRIAVRKRLQGTDQPYLNTSLLPDIVIPLPPEEEIQAALAEIGRQTSFLAEIEVQVASSSRRSSRLRQSVLKSAFEGKLVEQDPTDEPASVLLARIRAEREGRMNTTSRRVTKGQNTQRRRSNRIKRG